MTTKSPSDAILAPTSPAIEGVCDDLQFEAIEETADLLASYWRSIAEAAFRRERLTIEVHCRQVAKGTRLAFETVKELSANQPGSHA